MSPLQTARRMRSSSKPSKPRHCSCHSCSKIFRSAGRIANQSSSYQKEPPVATSSSACSEPQESGDADASYGDIHGGKKCSHVSGVGKRSQEAWVQLANQCRYTSPVTPGSRLLLLLGLKSFRKALIDARTHGKLLVLPGPGGVESKCSPGTMVMKLELRESGPLILP